jgi:hypothetical protein
MQRKPWFVLATVGCSLAFLAGCNSATSPPSEPAGPRLLSPISGVRFLQNDPSSGCKPDSTFGQGIHITFDWENFSGAAGYRIVYQGAVVPLISETVEESGYEFRSCGFIADSNLDGWTWRVGALMPKADGGRDTLWSEVRINGFAPCRLSDGRACYTP